MGDVKEEREGLGLGEPEKGGAGKSTLCTQTAVVAQMRGLRVAIADVDPQASSYRWGQLRGETREPSVIVALPGRLAMVASTAAELGYDLLMVDTAPRTDDGVLAAIQLADLIICPTRPTPFELMAMDDMVRVLDLVGRKQLALAVVNSVTPGTEQSQAAEYDAAVYDLKRHGMLICASYLCRRKAITNAIGKGAGVTESEAP